jgi:glucose/arabinose dehydrogenase
MSKLRKWLLISLVVIVALVGLGYVLTRPTPAKHTVDEMSGRDPLIVEPDVERFPSISIAKPIGWAAGEAPTPAKGLAVDRFADGLEHPRVLLTLPNGDVLVSEADAPEGNLGSGIEAVVARLLMSSAGAQKGSPDKLLLLRDADGDGKAEARHVLRQGNGLASPSGLGWRDGTLYVANHDAVVAFPYALGETTLAAAPNKLMDLPPSGNHWMRNLVLSPDGTKLYVAVGSASNIAEKGMEIEQGRAAIWELDIKSGRSRQFAQGLRNANGLDWNPATGELWTVVNERDMLGPDLVPDYLTNVPVGAHYGWPWLYWKTYDDDRVVGMPPDFIDDYVRKPEFGLGSHTAPLGLAFLRGGERMGTNFANGAFIARHGSWNRYPQVGYDVVFVAFDANGNPQGKPLAVLTGFLDGKDQTRGRPTWVAFDKTGALLVTDDTAGIVWRVSAPGAAPGAAVRPVQTARMPPQRELDGNFEAQYRAGFRKDASE